MIDQMFEYSVIVVYYMIIIDKSHIPLWWGYGILPLPRSYRNLGMIPG